jgi:hypothetical protein
MNYLKAFITGFVSTLLFSPRLTMAVVRRRIFAASTLEHDVVPN